MLIGLDKEREAPVPPVSPELVNGLVETSPRDTHDSGDPGTLPTGSECLGQSKSPTFTFRVRMNMCP